MIAKRISLRNVNKSSFTRLTEYISSTQGKNERIGEIRLTNCGGDIPEQAAKEIELVQSNNKRTKMDKTYHLLVSFREGDRPSQEVPHIIEDRLIAAIGYSEHQRISAVHYDTDHTHLHIAINKIHPRNFKAIEPYYDKRNLGVECEKLEIELNLLRDNHIPRMTQGAARAQDMEKAAGLESLIGWVKRGCMNDLLAATSWESLHATLASNGLQILPRGNGLVITNGTVGAKASSIHRQLSKKALEEKLGSFRAATISKDKSQGQGTEGYKIRPMVSKVDTSNLWQQYQQERQKQGQGSSWRIEKAKERKDRLIKAAKAGARIKRMGIKLLEGKISKKILYHQVSQGLLKEIKKINQAYLNERASFAKDSSNRLVWHDWLKAQAQSGNTEALEVLRHRYERQSKYGNIVTSIVPGNDNRDAIKAIKIDTVTKRGTIHYQVADGIVRDDGKRLRMADNLSDKALKAALQLSIKRFGTQLDVQGTEKFKNAMVRINHKASLAVSFSDPAMAAQQQKLIEDDLASQRRQSMVAAAVKYITERNEKRERGLSGILPHREYTDKDTGQYAFAGWRRMEKTDLLLLKTPTEILVKPIDEKTGRSVKYLDVGNQINITPEGAVQPRAEGHVRAHRLTRSR